MRGAGLGLLPGMHTRPPSQQARRTLRPDDMTAHFSRSSSKYSVPPAVFSTRRSRTASLSFRKVSCVPDPLFLGSWMSPPFPRVSALHCIFSYGVCLEWWSQTTQNVQHLSIIIKAQSSVGPRPVVRCGLRPFRRLLGNDLPPASRLRRVQLHRCGSWEQKLHT